MLSAGMLADLVGLTLRKSDRTPLLPLSLALVTNKLSLESNSDYSHKKGASTGPPKTDCILGSVFFPGPCLQSPLSVAAVCCAYPLVTQLTRGLPPSLSSLQSIPLALVFLAL